MKYADPDGKNAVKVVDEESCTITVKAVYYVQTNKAFEDDPIIGYTENDIKYLNKIDDDLNKKQYSVSEGEYAGYNVRFDLEFKNGGNLEEAKESAKSEEYYGINIGNSFTVGDGTKIGYFFPTLDDSGQPLGRVGGITSDHADITMNSETDHFSQRVHEIFHTFFFDNDNAKKGIGTYFKPGKINQEDINMLINNQALPKTTGND